MSRPRIVSALALLTLFAVGFSAPTGRAPAAPSTPSPYDPAAHGLPDAIEGYKVLAVLDSVNTACMPVGLKRLVLQASEPSQEEFLAQYRPEAIQRALELRGLKTTQWLVQVVGPGASTEAFLAENDDWNNSAKRGGCPKLEPLRNGSDWDEITIASGHNGVAVFEDLDAGQYTDDNAQGVDLVAPSSLGASQNAFSAFLNNVLTNGGYFLQDGFLFREDGTGRVIWADDRVGLVAQYYNISYTGGNSYRFTITYTSSVWQMCARDNQNPGTYTCITESQATGTHLAADLNTSIFAENANTNSNWYSGFTSPWVARNARIYRNGIGQNWSSNHRHTADACTASWPATDALSGSLANDGTGYVYPRYVPLHCD